MIKAIFGCKNTTKFLIESLSKRIDIDYLITIDEEMMMVQSALFVQQIIVI